MGAGGSGTAFAQPNRAQRTLSVALGIQPDEERVRHDSNGQAEFPAKKMKNITGDVVATHL